MKKKSKKKVVLITLLVIFVALGIGVWIFISGMSKPKDLGIKVSEEAYKSALAKLNIVMDDALINADPDKYEYIYGEPQEVDVKLTSEELTSYINYNSKAVEGLKQAQVRVNKDDTVDFSGVISKDYFLNQILGGQVAEEDLLKENPALKLLPEKITLYVNLSGEIANNTSDITVGKVNVLGINLPKKLYNNSGTKENIDGMISDYISNMIAENSGSYDYVKAENGELVLKGMLPTTTIQEKQNNG